MKPKRLGSRSEGPIGSLDQVLEKFQHARRRFRDDLNVRARTTIVQHQTGRLTWLLRLGANPNARDRDGVSLLGLAMTFGREYVDDLIEVLLRQGADPNLPLVAPAITPPPGFEGPCALHSAILQNLEPMIHLLGRYGADPNRLANGVPPLMTGFIVSRNRLDLVDALLNLGAAPRTTDAEGHTVWSHLPPEADRSHEGWAIANRLDRTLHQMVTDEAQVLRDVVNAVGPSSDPMTVAGVTGADIMAPATPKARGRSRL